MIAMIAARLIAGGVAPKLARPLVYALLAALAVALFVGAKAAYDHHVISTNDAQIEAKAEKANRKADSRAADARLADQQRRDAEAADLSATLEAPDATPASLHAAQRAFYRCVRQQREAREAGRPPAACGP